MARMGADPYLQWLPVAAGVAAVWSLSRSPDFMWQQASPLPGRWAFSPMVARGSMLRRCVSMWQLAAAGGSWVRRLAVLGRSPLPLPS